MKMSYFALYSSLIVKKTKPFCIPIPRQADDDLRRCVLFLLPPTDYYLFSYFIPNIS